MRLPERIRAVVATATLLATLGCDNQSPPTTSSLVLYCAAGIRGPIGELTERFEAQVPGCTVQVQFGGSGTMLAQLTLRADGDLYVAADGVFMQQAEDRDLIDEWVTMARLRPVLAVPTGNPAGIRSLDDIKRDGVRFGIGDPVATAVGRLTKQMLERDGQWIALEARISTTAGTVNELATALAIGSLDAGIIWTATANQNDRIDVVTQLGGDDDVMDVPIAVLKASRSADLARKFIELAVSQEGAAIFRKHHFEATANPATTDEASDGDPAELVLFCGGSMRLPIEELLPTFEKANNVTIHRQYNGCGILIGQMKAGMKGDVYYSCDQSFMDQAVGGGYSRPEDGVLTLMKLVIVVPRGNPKNIRTLEDLARPGMKVVLGNEHHGAVGRTAYRLLDRTGLREKIENNVVKTAPTADLLLMDVAIGTVDAGIVWDVVARGSRRRIEMIELPAEVSPPARQPISVMAETKHPALSAKLVAYLRSETARAVFDKYGFGRPAPAEVEPVGAGR